MERAARRIGTFHERASEAVPDDRLDRYDARMFAFWASRAASRLPDVPWLARVCDAFPSFASSLQGTSSTMIHGEFYPQNVLVSTEEIMAVDWEWAGMGLGEIDLAALTENWAESTIAACTAAYAQSRRIHPADKLFRKRLAASQLYLHLRWLGGRKPCPMGEEARTKDASTSSLRLENVHSLAAELGIL
jgi:aminoglycoside phosphotransferase (APT) family kinase protein